MTNERKLMMNPSDVEAIYGISRRQQARLRAAGKLSFFKLSAGRGGRILYRHEDLEWWLQGQRREAAST